VLVDLLYPINYILVNQQNELNVSGPENSLNCQEFDVETIQWCHSTTPSRNAFKNWPGVCNWRGMAFSRADTSVKAADVIKLLPLTNTGYYKLYSTMPDVVQCD